MTRGSVRARYIDRLVNVAWIGGGALCVLLALYVVAADQVLSLLSENRAAVATWVGKRIGMRVEIDRVDGRMRLFTPVVNLRGVRVYVPDGDAPVLEVPVTDLEIDTLASALRARPVLDLLRLDGLGLTLLENPDGSFRVKGFPFDVNDAGAAERLRQALTVLYRQNDIVVTHARLAIESERVPLDTVENIEWHAHNDGEHHELAGSATLVGPSRVPVSMALAFDGEPLTPAEIVGDLYLRLRPSAIEGWLPRRDAGGLWLDALAGGGDAWLRLEHGRVTSVTGRAQVDSVAGSLDDGRKVEGLLGLSGRFRWEARDDGWRVAVGDLGFRRRGLSWPESDFALDVTRDASGRAQRVRASLTRGSIDMIAGFADLLPAAQQALAGRLAKLNLTGRLGRTYVEWDADAPEDSRWHAQVDIAQVGLSPDGGVPGIGALAGHLELWPQAGYAALSARHTNVLAPTLFMGPVALDAVDGRVVWYRRVDGLTVKSDRVTVANPDAHGSVVFSVDLPNGDASPELRLLGLLTDGVVRNAHRYLPVTASDGLRDWLQRAPQGGHVRRAGFLFDGPVRHDAPAPRTFQMRFEADGVDLAFLPEWPLLRGADADVLIADGRVDAHGTHGRLLDSVLSGFAVTVTPVADAASDLEVNSRVDGDLADAFAVLQKTPVRDVLPAELMRWQGSGRLASQVSLETSLAAGASPHVTVEGELSGGALSAPAHGLDVSDVSGSLRYDTRDGFSARNLRGRGFDVAFAGGARTVPVDGHQQTQVDLRGRLNMAAVNDWLKVPVLGLVKGEADAALQLRFDNARGGTSLLELRSDLRGISAAAPQPIGKAADVAVDTRLTYDLGTDAPNLVVQSGRNFALDLRLRDGAPESGVVQLGGTKLSALPAKGIAIEGAVGTLSLAEWLAFSQAMTGDRSAAPAGPLTPSRAIAGIAALGERLQRVNVGADRLDAWGFPLDKATLRMGRDPAGWSVQIDSKPLGGQLILPDGYTERGDKPLVIQLGHLDLAVATLGAKGGAFDISPANVPRLALALANIRVGGEDYGSWSLETVPVAGGVQLREVKGAWRALDIQGGGDWTAGADGGTRTHFTGTAKADDMARVAEAFGFQPDIRSADARGNFDLAWPGRPVDIDTARMSGSVDLDVRDGRFVTGSARSQALRALGIFNVSTWQRRLKLNFTDLYRKGVAFDTLAGKVTIDGGVLATDNLAVKGPSAAFEIAGKTDIGTRALDSKLRVTLPVNSNLYLGCLAGLAACAGIAIVEKMWGDRLEKMTTLVYDVKGTWDDPQVKELAGAQANPSKG